MDQVGLHLDSKYADHTIAVNGGDGCASLAARCGISGNKFMSYNPGLDCSKLVVDQVSDLPECSRHFKLRHVSGCAAHQEAYLPSTID